MTTRDKGITLPDVPGQYLSVKDKTYGAVGNGTTDDTAAISAAIVAATAANRTLFFPKGIYKVSSTLAITCNTIMDKDAYLLPDGFAANTAVFSVNSRTSHFGIRIQGDLAVDPANGTVGIKLNGLNASRSNLTQCSAVNLKYGCLNTTFSCTLLDCKFNYNTTNYSAYATSSGVQINDTHIIAGNYSNPLGPYAIKIGDSDFSTTVIVGQPHGSCMSVRDIAIDAGTLKVESVLDVVLDTIYCESPSLSKCIELAKDATQDGYVGNVTVRNCFFYNTDYAVYCNAGISTLNVEPCTYISVAKCALYIRSDIYPYEYKKGYAISSFTAAPEVHTGRRHAIYTTYSFVNTSIPSSGIIAGVQRVISEPTEQYAGGVWINKNDIKRPSNSQFGTGRRYKTPATAKAGTLNSYVFSLTTVSDAKYFNGGDEYDAGALGGGVIDRVDYEAGQVYLSDSSVGVPTAGTLSQNTSVWHTTTSTTTGAPPASGTYLKGDVCDNHNSTVGAAKRWQCTTGGSPGTWTSEGNL